MQKEREQSLEGRFAEIDFLTGAFTRTYLRPDFAGDCTLVDIISLRDANSRSYSTGDQLLKQAVKKLMPYGPVVRIGGDEFLILGRKLSRSHLYDEQRMKAWVATEYKEREETWLDFIDHLWAKILAEKEV